MTLTIGEKTQPDEVQNTSHEAKTALEKLLHKSSSSMPWLERLEMVVTDISYPFAHVARVRGKINPTEPQLWTKPNIALRVEVGGETDKGEGKRPLTRVYTIRQFDKATNEMELDFVIHEGDAPAMEWLDRAKVGTSVFLTGPRHHFVPDYSCPKNIAFFADDTAIPALYAILLQWPENRGPEDRRSEDSKHQDRQVSIYIDCADGAYAHELPRFENISYHIHVRGKEQEAGKSGYLPARAKAIKNRHDWQIWVACEREEARAIRQYFTENDGLSEQDIKAVGYWKLGLSASQLDQARLAHYAALHAAGKEILSTNDFDIPI